MARAGLQVLPRFFSPHEQHLLLAASLALLALPSHASSLARTRLRPFRALAAARPAAFLPPEAYHFLPAHFDGVIHRYRELLVPRAGFAALPGPHPPDLAPTLQRLCDLLPAPGPRHDDDDDQRAALPLSPPPHLLMHLLHLAPDGEILPHVDNLDAFGHTIVGASLGSSRVIRFTPTRDAAGEDPFEVLLEPGSVYVQTDPLRTHFKHAVPALAQWEGRQVGGEQRLSIMLRDRHPSP